MLSKWQVPYQSEQLGGAVVAGTPHLGHRAVKVYFLLT
jgi:hypothetical protein